MPSKKVLSIIIIVVALVTSIIITFGKEKSSATIDLASNLISGQKVSIPENPDWQDELGQLDGKVQTLQINTTEPETTTDSVSINLMSNYLTLRQNGSLDEESIQKIVNQAASYTNKTSNIKQISQLNLIEDNGKETIKQYGENLGYILKSNRPNQSKDEREIMSEAMSLNDASKLKDLDYIIPIYKKMSSELEKMPVPKTFSKAHIDMLNSILTITSSLEEFKSVFNDPIIVLPALKKYTVSGQTFIQALRATIEFIKKNEIIYKQGSGGYYLIYGI